MRASLAAASVLLLTGCSVSLPRPATTSAPPAPAVTSTAPAPAATGRAPRQTFEVDTRQLRLRRGADRPLPVTIWYPDADAGRLPVILFSHGLTGRPGDYAPLLERWASAGFVIAAPVYPHTSGGAERFDALDVVNQPADATYVLTEVLKLDRRAGDALRGRLATDRLAAAGHSAGGITTIGLFSVARDERLDAGIVLAGSALGVGLGFTGPPAPLLFVHGQRDSVVSYASGQAVYASVPWPKAFLTLPDGDHGQSLLRDGNEAFDVVADSTLDFWRWSLYGDADAKRRLPDDAESAGLGRLDDKLG
ncbi:chlorophyllase [Phytohabitans sp. ZYX-F-186]|uniref:Chlorophyllase n=1 Tax=Phytohabitans maris TaxID=3071409 RepID=A0ABU0ZJL3_9ACTN|nr:chlorophyllase [Phytohabitans sp. ZYX-F-186]MDQ7907241.1 chlorophyllase [Phytohabitans sp. ZYX-F-186]